MVQCRALVPMPEALAIPQARATSPSASPLTSRGLTRRRRRLRPRPVHPDHVRRHQRRASRRAFYSRMAWSLSGLASSSAARGHARSDSPFRSRSGIRARSEDLLTTCPSLMSSCIRHRVVLPADREKHRWRSGSACLQFSTALHFGQINGRPMQPCSTSGSVKPMSSRPTEPHRRRDSSVARSEASWQR